MYADPNKPYSNQNFEDNITMNVMGNIPGLKSFIANRRTSLISQLAAYGCNMGVNDFSDYSLQFSITPNPNHGSFTIDGEVFPVQIKIYNSLGEIVKEKLVENNREIINVNEASGIYFFQIISDEIPVSSGKFVIE